MKFSRDSSVKKIIGSVINVIVSEPASRFNCILTSVISAGIKKHVELSGRDFISLPITSLSVASQQRFIQDLQPENIIEANNSPYHCDESVPQKTELDYRFKIASQVILYSGGHPRTCNNISQMIRSADWTNPTNVVDSLFNSEICGPIMNHDETLQWEALKLALQGKLTIANYHITANGYGVSDAVSHGLLQNGDFQEYKMAIPFVSPIRALSLANNVEASQNATFKNPKDRALAFLVKSALPKVSSAHGSIDIAAEKILAAQMTIRILLNDSLGTTLLTLFQANSTQYKSPNFNDMRFSPINSFEKEFYSIDGNCIHMLADSDVILPTEAKGKVAVFTHRSGHPSFDILIIDDRKNERRDKFRAISITVMLLRDGNGQHQMIDAAAIQAKLINKDASDYGLSLLLASFS